MVLRIFSKDYRDCGWIRGSGLNVIMNAIARAEYSDGFAFILIIGERGRGKSSLALNLAGRVIGEENVLDALVFTIDDFDSKTTNPPDNLLAEDRRVRMLIWDDMGLHFSTYMWFTPHQRQRMQEFIENFQTVREDLAILVGTVAELEILPPKVRSSANIIIDCYRRSRAKVFTYTRYLWFRKWKVVGEIEWGPPIPDIYKKYREMKRRAHRAKKKIRLLSRTKLAKVYLDVLQALMAQEALDIDTLYGMGIIDINNNITDWGHYLLNKDERLKMYIELMLEKDMVRG